MLRTTLKGLLAHRVRLAMTALAIVLGVAFVAGTFVLTDTIDRVFVDLVGNSTSGYDLAVRGEPSFTNIGTGQSSETRPVPEQVLEDVRAVEGVADAEGSVSGYAQIVDPDGEAITPMGPPTLGQSWTEVGGLGIRDGRPPQGPDEVAIDASTADDNGLAVGDRVTVLFSQIAPREFEIVGITTFGEANNLAGATMAVFDTATAQQVLNSTGEFTSIEVRAADGADLAALEDRIAEVLPEDIEVITAEALAAETTDAIRDALGFLQIALGVFAAIALFVGAFIIANTFTIVVAQRTREFALLRALGASNRQVVGSVVTEAAIIGLVSSLVGILVGLGLAAGLQALLSTFGGDLPTGGLVMLPRTVVVSIVVGVVVTVLASLLPARRAARVEPVAALREVATPPRASSRLRTVAGAVLVTAGVGLLVVTLTTSPDNAAALIGLAAFLTLLGVGGLAPLISRPVARVVGAPAARLGMPGRLAQGNAMRTPRRTSATASALMIGLALVSFVAVLASSLKASADEIIDGELAADVVVRPANSMAGGGFTPVVAERLRAAEGIGAVAELRAGNAVVEGDVTFLGAIDPEVYQQVTNIEIVEGSMVDLASVGTIMVDSEIAERRGLEVGDEVTVEFSATGEQSLTVAAIYTPGQLNSGWYLGNRTYERNFNELLDLIVLATVVDGMGAEADAALAAVADEFPNVVVENQAEYKETVSGQVDQMLAMVTALLGMAIIISILGITNTLALSVHERTREIGLLRAVGATRRQVRSMIRWEAVIVAVLGALLGIVVGTGYGWAIVTALEDEGVRTFVLPGGQLVIYVVLAALAGVLAAVFPARRAARLDVLRAVTVE